MGRIKSILIKKASRQLLDGDHPFTESFDYDKRLLRGKMPSKSTGNKIAGYIARLVKMRKIEKIKQDKKDFALLTSSSPQSSAVV